MNSNFRAFLKKNRESKMAQRRISAQQPQDAKCGRGAAPRREWRAERREAHVVAMFGLGAAGPTPAPRTGRRVQSALRRGTIDLAMPPHQSRHGTSAPFRAGVPRSSPGEAAPRPDALQYLSALLEWHEQAQAAVAAAKMAAGD